MLNSMPLLPVAGKGQCLGYLLLMKAFILILINFKFYILWDDTVFDRQGQHLSEIYKREVLHKYA